MDDPLRFSKYSVDENLLPTTLNVPSDIEQLVSWSVPKVYGFENEQKIVDNYNTQKANNLAIAASASVVNDKPVSPEPVSAPAPTKTTAPETGGNASDGSNKNSSVWYEEQVNKMITETGQNKEVCQFYLESMDWNLEQAVSMYKNMVM